MKRKTVKMWAAWNLLEDSAPAENTISTARNESIKPRDRRWRGESVKRLYCSDFDVGPCCNSCHDDDDEGRAELFDEERTLDGNKYTASVCCRVSPKIDEQAWRKAVSRALDAKETE